MPNFEHPTPGIEQKMTPVDIAGLQDFDMEYFKELEGENGKNVTHTVVDPKFRGQGLAAKFKQKLMDELGLDFITMTINMDNTASIKATEKLPGVKKMSDRQYEDEFHKVKFVYASRKRNN